MTQADLPVAIIGAGPVGLAAPAHLLARHEQPLVLEAGPAIAHNIRAWGHVRMFTPWRYCIDAAARVLLEKNGWQHPPAEHVPTGPSSYAIISRRLPHAFRPTSCWMRG
jgi:cation diffusion facilitator CzcD-associated flavoprotein CzcO